jgi:curved DNA-binding protein CbpA
MSTLTSQAMSAPSSDPYAILGVSSSATDDELRTAYRRLAPLHHPDHNNGSHESAARFAAVQEAYARVRLLRHSAAGPAPTTAAGGVDDRFNERLAKMEQELKAAREQRAKAVRAADEALRNARRAASGDEGDRPSDEELGYVSSNDSFTKILDDFTEQVSSRFSEVQDAAGHRPSRARPRSITDWIDELSSKLTGDHERDSNRDSDRDREK